VSSWREKAQTEGSEDLETEKGRNGQRDNDTIRLKVRYTEKWTEREEEMQRWGDGEMERQKRQRHRQKERQR
jgi:hypothetical protein